MSCYQLILKRMHPDAPVSGTIYCLRSGHQATVELDTDTLEEFARELTLLGNQILDEDYNALLPTPLDICPECDFLPRCARYWREQERRDHGFEDGALFRRCVEHLSAENRIDSWRVRIEIIRRKARRRKKKPFAGSA